jgi:Flavin-binding monooxygenase-like
MAFDGYHDPMTPDPNDNPPSAHVLGASPVEKFCVLGAGSSGLAVAKNFRQFGIPFDCLERENDVGGNWYYGASTSSVYRSTRLISSKPLTEYTDFPMPEHYPDLPDRDMVWRYLRNYAEHFDLHRNIEFNACVERIEPAVGKSVGWDVTLSGGPRRRYQGVVIANGHNWDPRWPEYPGKFEGLTLHSSQYKTSDVLAGRRVLVVGGGNSGHDIAAESARYAGTTFHSLRRSYPLLPRFFRGRPVDQSGEWMLRWRLPLWLRRLAIARVMRLAWRPQLPAADHAFFETHPAINGRWPIDVRRGAIVVKPDVRELRGSKVIFHDDTTESVDVIVYATGFNISFPFLDANQLGWQDDRPELFLNMLHPRRDDFFVVGLIQPDSGQFGLVDLQAQLIATYLQGLARSHAPAARLQRAKRHAEKLPTNAIEYVASARHLLEVEHFSYRRQLTQWIEHLHG